MTVKENEKDPLLVGKPLIDDIRVGWQLCAGGDVELFDALWEKLSKPFKMVWIGRFKYHSSTAMRTHFLPGVDDYWRSIAMLGFCMPLLRVRGLHGAEAHTEITLTGLVWLNQYTRQLKYDAVYLSALSNFTNLKVLAVENANGLHGLADIYNLPIETLHLKFESGRVPLDSIFEFQQLKHLNIRVGSDADCAHLRDLSFLSKTTTLESLSLDIDLEGCHLASMDGIGQYVPAGTQYRCAGCGLSRIAEL